VVAKLFSIDWNNSVEEFELLVNKVDKAGGIRAAIEKLSSQPIVDAKSLVLSNNDESTKSSGIEEIVEEEKEVVREEHHSNNDRNQEVRDIANVHFPKKIFLLPSKNAMEA
ncbi:MAG: hypothetical protein ACJ72Q_00905, partial [Nitrososphaeraceae archaeon]